MRPLLILSLVGTTPALAAPAPQCALPSLIPIVDVRPQEPARPPTQPAVAAAGTASHEPATPLPDLTSIPFIRHVTSAGATISDFGVSHGMRSISARNGDQFMVFQITPDGQAAVSGTLTELTAAQLTTAANGNVTPLAAKHGLDGLFVRSGSQFQVFYITPDQQRVIPGVLWDAGGKDLTRDQVANVPGAIPTVVVGDVGAAGKPGAGGVSQGCSTLSDWRT